MRTSAGALGAALVLLCTPAAAGEPLVDRVELALEAARTGIADPSPEAMDRVRALLGLPDRTVIGGRGVRVRPDPLLERLSGRSSTDFRRAVDRLAALRAASMASATADPVDGAALRRALPAPPEPGILRRVLDRLGAFLAGVGRAVGSAGGLLVLAVVAAVAAVGWLLLRRAGIGVGTAVREDQPRPASARQRRQEAAAALATGDVEAAMRLAYGAVVAALAGRGIVQDTPGLTATRVRLAARRRGNLAAIVDDATSRYERVRYGRVPAEAADVESLLAAQRAVEAA